MPVKTDSASGNENSGKDLIPFSLLITFFYLVFFRRLRVGGESDHA